METKKVIILNVHKNEISIRIKKKKKSYWTLSVFFIMAFFLSFAFGTGEIKHFGYSMSQIYNPVSSLYNDNSDVIFTNGTITGEVLGFYVPVIGNYELAEDGTITFLITNSIMIKASESGVVDGVGVTNNGIKYIKIKHSEDVFSLIENVDIVGIETGEIVKRGQDIATAKEGSKVYFQLFKDNMKISNLKIESTKIIWEN